MDDTKALIFTVLGGGGEVGANCFQLTIAGHQVLLDCGTHPKKEGYDALPQFSLLHRAPEALIISHGHVDHCGAVPYLIRQFPLVRAYATLPTARIMDRMLHNSVAVMGTMARERGISDYPLYEHDDVNHAMRRVSSRDYEERFSLNLPVPAEASLHHAGHVLGSASILVRTPGHTLFYTGDICEVNQELMGGYAPLPADVDVDTLVIESTHGSVDETGVKPYSEEAVRLGESIAEVLHGGGAVLVPSFALGRTQEILNVISRLQEEGVIPEVPVYASGLGRAIYELYDRFENYLDPGAVLRPLEQFGRIGNVWEPSVVSQLIAHPCIIVATSGMMLENTPSAMIAQEMVRNHHHGIFFVGYLDSETLGYKLLHATPGERLQFCLGRPAVEVQLENIKRFFFSAHAPRTALRAVVDRLRPKNVVYVHGDPDAIEWMKSHNEGDAKIYSPTIGQSVTLEA